MSEFRKEHRYTVLKQTDIAAAIESGTINEEQIRAFDDFCRTVHIARVHVRKKEALECVVVEHDWRIYESVWSLVEMEHNSNQKLRELRASRIEVAAMRALKSFLILD